MKKKIVGIVLVALAMAACGKQESPSDPSIPVSEIQEQETQSIATETMIEETEEEPKNLQIVMVGDMLIHTRVIESGIQEDGTYNYDHLFKNVKDIITEADLAIVNQETIMGGEELGYSGYPSFNSPYAIADAEVEAGFDVILHATNHTLDKGKKAVLNCMDYWSNYPEVSYVGINGSQEEQDNIYVYEQDGMKVAILNYTYSTNGVPIPKDMPYIVNMLVDDNKEEIIEDIQRAEEIADFTIVCPHWGTEYNLGISKSQEKWADIFLENGVDLVLGAHPHVIEPIEWLTHENGNEMLVYYSLGNFVNATSSTGRGISNRMLGGIADVTIGRNEEGEVVILEHDVIPIVCHMADGSDFTIYRLEDYTEELAQEHQILSQDLGFSKAFCESIYLEVWGAE